MASDSFPGALYQSPVANPEGGKYHLRMHEIRIGSSVGQDTALTTARKFTYGLTYLLSFLFSSFIFHSFIVYP